MIDPSTRLRRAILLNDILLVQRVLRNYPQLLQNPDFDDKSNTSLHLAAIHGCFEIAECLLLAGHEAHEISRNADHETPLMLAARHGRTTVGTLLIQRTPRSIAYFNRVGLDALSIAAQNPSSTLLIPPLLQHPHFPVSPHIRDHNGNTPLHHASAAGSLKALRILLAAGANPQAQNHHDWTPLAYSQTVAAEVYFKNLVADFERIRAEGAKLLEEREKARAAGVRLVEREDEEAEEEEGRSRMDGRGMVAPGQPRMDAEDALLIGDALKRHWSPVERKRPPTPASGTRREWGAVLGHARTRSGS